MLLRDEQWRDHDRDYQKYMERLAATVDELAELGAEFTRMKQMDQARLQSLFNFAREFRRLRAMADVKKATEPIVRLEQEIVARREEERRLGRMIVDVQQTAENTAHGYQDISGVLSKLEESTRQEGGLLRGSCSS